MDPVFSYSAVKKGIVSMQLGGRKLIKLLEFVLQKAFDLFSEKFRPVVVLGESFDIGSTLLIPSLEVRVVFQ